MIFMLGALGTYYAATDGILAVVATSILPDQQRASGLALLGAAMAIAAFAASTVFGALWEWKGPTFAVAVFLVGLVVSLVTRTGTVGSATAPGALRSRGQQLWMRFLTLATTDRLVLSASIVDPLLSRSFPATKVAPARRDEPVVVDPTQPTLGASNGCRTGSARSADFTPPMSLAFSRTLEERTRQDSWVAGGSGALGHSPVLRSEQRQTTDQMPASFNLMSSAKA